MTSPTDPTTEHEHIRVTVRTPSGASHEFSFRPAELVVAATATAVEHFVKAKELAPDDYGLALVRSGTAVALLDTNELRSDAIVDGDVLHLVIEKPQVDG
jgi:hypothetical protein